jgi:serine O-acetyltransferase
VHHNCTVGHRTIGGAGNRIGDDVVCYPGAKIVGDTSVGDGAVIGANAVVFAQVPAGRVVRAPGAHASTDDPAVRLTR